METTMKRTIAGTMLGAILIWGGVLNAAHADTWVFRDALRPNGHDRTMAAKQADGRKCGLSRNTFKDGSPFVQCMTTRGWVLDHIIPDPPAVHARVRNGGYDQAPPIDNSIDDDHRRQRDQDNTQQMLNQQNFINNQQMNNDMQAQQQQQQMINDMNR
jgi:hypothetical protein